MIRPPELRLNLPIELSNGVISTTSKVWEILWASYEGSIEKVKELVNACPELIYAQYNYTPPIHLAVREGHVELVEFLLHRGAHDPCYKTYPFLENLSTIANDRGHVQIAVLLDEYNHNPAAVRFKGDNGRIIYDRTEMENEFEKAVYNENLEKTKAILKEHPQFALDESFFWNEGILLFAAKENDHDMMDLLMSYGAKVPSLLKWTQAYYFERFDGAAYLMEKGMDPNTMNWHHVTILHDMAQKGFIDKASLLLKYGADIDPVDEEYQSTPLGMAARWGHAEMVEYLVKQGADINKSGAPWATPLAWARRKAHHEIEKLLLDSGGNR